MSSSDVPVALADIEVRYSEMLERLGREPNGHDASLLAKKLFKSGFAHGSNVYSPENINEAFDVLGNRAILARAQRLANFIGDTDKQRNKEAVKAALRALVFDKDEKRIPIKEWEEKVRNIYGAVITGHPVFGKSRETSGKLSEYYTLMASGRDDEQARGLMSQLSRELLEANRKDFAPLNLDQEYAYSIDTLTNMHEAVSIIEEAAIEVAQEEYPSNWKDIDYMPVTLATWIPFDWDGRTDITWNKALEKRIDLVKTMLGEDILYRLTKLRATLDKEDHKDAVGRLIEKVEETVGFLEKDIDFLTSYDGSKDKDYQILAQWEKESAAEKERRITHPGVLAAILQDILDDGTNAEAEKSLVHMRSRLHNHGITYAQIHARSNAQVSETHMFQKFDVENLPASEVDTLLFVKAEKFLKEVEDLENSANSKITYTEIARAKTIPYRKAALINKYGDYDSYSATRCLHAETHNAAVLLFELGISIAAKIDERIQTCPLTEDRAGVDLFKGTVARMYGANRYLEHIIKNGEACFQLGYSDSAKESGQLAAGNAMDHTAHVIVKEHYENVILPHKGGKRDKADCVIFFTHGESPGRGNLPTGVAERIAYLCTPHLINYANTKEVKLKAEESFQGGDGFLLHGTPESSLAYFTQAICYLKADHSDAANDIYYQDKMEGRDSIRRFLMEGNREHVKISQDPDHKSMVLHFKGMAPKTGSRSDTRQGGTEGQLRAIPYNEVLLQLGVQVPVYYGFGEHLLENVESYGTLVDESPEFRRRMSMIDATIDMDDPAVLDAYVKLYSPTFWDDLARDTEDWDKKITYGKIASHMKVFGHYEKYAEIVRRVYNDYEHLKACRKKLAFESEETPKNKQVRLENENAKREKNLAHSLRLASIMRLFEVAVTLPELAPGELAPRDQIIKDIMHFNPDGINVLKRIFETNSNGASAGGQSLLARVLQPDYSQLHERKIRPMEEMMGLIKNKASPVIMDLNGCVG